MKIRIQIIENTVQYFCHSGELSREDFHSGNIDRAVKEAVIDSGWQWCRDGVIKNDENAKEEVTIIMTEKGSDSWDYAPTP